MKRLSTQPHIFSVGQLARRWGLGMDRVRRLIESGLLPGAFRVPSSGKYGEAIRIPLSTVLKAEEQWAIPNHSQNRASTPPRYPRRGGVPELTHFPELTREHDGECREDDQR